MARIKYLDKAKGIAILLVVVGHLSRHAPPANAWYGILKWDIIYKFHMPFFMFLSGFIAYLHYKPIGSIRAYFEYLIHRLGKIAVTYVVFSAVVLGGKTVFATTGLLGNPSRGLLAEVYLVMTQPIHSCVGQVWYLYVLSMFIVILPGLDCLVKGRMLRLAVPSAILYFLPSTEMFCIELVMEYMLVFVLGCAAVSHRAGFESGLDKYGLWFMAAFGVSFWLGSTLLPNSIQKLIIGLLSIPALVYLSRMKWPVEQFIIMLGQDTLIIYLLHGIVIGVLRCLMVRLSMFEMLFAYVSPILVSAGVCVPLLMSRTYARAWKSISSEMSNSGNLGTGEGRSRCSS